VRPRSDSMYADAMYGNSARVITCNVVLSDPAFTMEPSKSASVRLALQKPSTRDHSAT